MAPRADAAAQTPSRTPLDRQRVLAAALALVDAEGLEALSMRRLGSDLGVDAMSIYKHVANKDALLDGIVEQLWIEIGAAVSGDSDWAGQVRSLAHAIRATAHRHPHAASLLLSRFVPTAQILETFATLLDALREAGFGDGAAARTVRSLLSYVIGYAGTELYWFDRDTGAELPPEATADTDPTTAALLWLGRILPHGTASRHVQAALAVIDCDPDGDFEAGLDVAIQGLRQLTTPGVMG